GRTGETGGEDMRAAAGTGGMTGRQGAMEREGMRGDEAMTRSEEQMHVGVERHESGRARLRKYVVTEEVQQTVPVTHEEVRVVREPITDANRDEALAGPEISEAEHEVTLHAERPVVETETVPVERVRMTTEELTENETVRGQVRKERIEAETESFTEDETGRGGERRGRE
ncbi:YsnF/AvaK domain-containing protein, partial [Streptomyces sp. MH60]|uniref:YsnF/AvaK domain-containing protein n=1 Tax=Streptomyces sp. MH60 TaxID=1940758 RepID=UPI001F543BCE